jgi:hypothetical protein
LAYIARPSSKTEGLFVMQNAYISAIIYLGHYKGRDSAL